VSTISHAPYLIPVVLILFCATVRARVAARRSGGGNIAFAIATQRTLLADVPAALLRGACWLVPLAGAWVLLSVVLPGGVPHDRTGWPLLAVAGLAVGLRLWTGPALAAAFLVGPVLADTTYTVVLVAPMLLGCLVRLALYQPELWRGSTVQMRIIARYGGVVQPPAPSRYLFPGLVLAAAAVPLVVVALVPGVEQPWRWTCAALVAAQLASSPWMTRRLYRVLRDRANLYLAGAVAAAALLAASPLGAILARTWSRTGWLTGIWGGLLLAGAASFTWLATKTDGNPLLTNAFRVIRAALVSAVLPCLVGVAFHPTPGTVTAATVLAAAETATLVAGRRRPYLRASHERTAAEAARLTPPNRLYDLGPWLYDAVWRHPDRPDLSLVRRYTGFAARSARGELINGQAFRTTDAALRHPLTGAKALLWTTIADQALDAVDREVLPRVPLAKQPALRTASDAARADVVAARGLVLALGERWPQAGSEWQHAADRYQRLDATYHAAAAQAMAALIAAVHLAQPDTAARTLEAIPGPVAAAAPIRHLTAATRAAGATPDSTDRATQLASAGSTGQDAAALTATLARDPGIPVWHEDLCDAYVTLARDIRSHVQPPRSAHIIANDAATAGTVRRII
jgi:hypothetical protein